MKNKERFLDFAESLKLVRKTRIEDFIDDRNIDDIYTDLLPNNGIINKLNLPRTTILVGRKGTGKSTIFQKSQKDLISNNKCISIYIDVKSLYDNSTPTIPLEIESVSKELQKYLLFSNLIKEIVLETKNRLDDFVQVSILKRILGFDKEQIDKINLELDEIEKSISDVTKQVDASLITNYKLSNQEDKEKSVKGNINISTTPKMSIEGSLTKGSSIKSEFETSLVTYLDIKKSLISKLTSIKEILNIDHLYIFLDDYSEIDEESQKVFMDWFISPLNNLSDDFVKFKIAIYPNRFYYGKLDNSKIDEISLDFFDAFYTFEKQANITKMETLALDYTKRLIKKRLHLFFPNNNWEKFFSIDESEIYDILFSTSFNIPRKIGFLLSYCYESCLIHDVKISKEAIENASKRYYSDVIEKYFIANQFVTKPFKDKISNNHQYQLLNNIIKRQKTNSSSSIRTRIKGKPTNHFVVNKEISNLLDNLELNGFLTTYNNINDNNDNISVLYSLDYGLCKTHNLNFARAYNSRLIKYFTQARFNMNILISDYFNKTQLIKCPNNHEFSYEMLKTLKAFKMRCPDCLDEGKSVLCEVTLSSEEVRERLRAIENKRIKKLSFTEFLILDYLNGYQKIVSIHKIASALDKSESSVNTMINKLIEKGLIEHDNEASRALKKEVYLISDKGVRFINTILKLIDEIKKKENK
ncbi:hypothetical protein WH52_08380 [Tenacibaculum holothuriorum]|uniref:Uncharacterized protein n=1 Tax=Tenacibaculum holothuriorum TaxID=1635173 RepID=A0A1Y2PC22_9FLAO|nr:hypothetical protein [Tenacibaculum holothuriorum]OSY88036.1 hypothetical protein WH52_08380 [Tenacibaculum holothuriorum]